MKDYAVDNLRNVCFMSHGGAGKTTLAEAMLFNTGVLDRFGRVLDGNTTTDFDPEETKRKISINTALAPCDWKGCKINIIDTPGYFDFAGEVMQGIRVAEGAIILAPAKSGVEVGTEKSWNYAVKANVPVMFFISKMDEENANFDSALDQLTTNFGKCVVPFQFPLIEGEKFVGVADVLKKKAYRFSGDKVSETEIPAPYESKVNEIEEKIMEAVAESSESLMDKYFGGEEFSGEEIKEGLTAAMADRTLVPVFCGSAINNQGISILMDAVVEYMPAPNVNKNIIAKKPDSEEEVRLDSVPGEKLAALVFKTIVDPFVGKISIFRVFSGTITSDMVAYNSTTGKTEKISQVFTLRGKKQINTEKIIAGDIGAVAKLQSTNTNDTLCDQANPVVLAKIEFPRPSLTLAIEPRAKGDDDKISSGLQRLQDEDRTFKSEIHPETRQSLISGLGEQHLDIIVSKLKAKFGVAVDLKDPIVPYRETIKKKVRVEGKHKKQSGGHGQFGHVWIEFEPGTEQELAFEEKVFGGAVPRQYFPAVEKGLRESVQHGVLAGYPVVNLKATLVDGSYHPVDSSEMAFKVAAGLAYKKGLEEANPALLEPISHVEVLVPDNNMGDIIGDLNKRRGRILGMNQQIGGIQQVVAEVPTAEMFKYATDLRSMTQGRGSFSETFERYEEAPSMVSEKVIRESKKDAQEEK